MSDSDNSVFQEVQAALLNSECDPFEAGKQGLCALYSFVGTELEGSPLAAALERALTDMHWPVVADGSAPPAPVPVHLRARRRHRIARAGKPR